MNDSAEQDEFLDGNTENTYEELSKVVNAKNIIKSRITSSNEQFIRIESELEELEDVLHDIRSKITSNPILLELNSITEEDATFQRKLAEGIYQQLPDISSKLDLYQENFSKFNEEYNKIQKLQSSTDLKFDEKISTMTSLKTDLANKYGQLNKNLEENELRGCQELREKIRELSEIIAKENDTFKYLSYEIESKRNIVQKLSEVNHDLANLVDLKDNEINSNEKKILDEKQVELDKSIIELTERANELESKMNGLNQQKKSLQIANTELRRKNFDHQQSLMKKKVMDTFIQDLKILLAKKNDEFHNLKESISKQENASQSDLQHCELEVKNINDEIQKQTHLREQRMKEIEEINETKAMLSENIKQLDKKLSVCLENKNKETVAIDIFIEKEKFLLDELNKVKESIDATDSVTRELNEKISNVQNEIDENTKLAQETPSYDEAEKDNKILDLKIRRYIKAIEVCKRNRAAIAERNMNSRTYSNSSEDSMLLPKKKHN